MDSNYLKASKSGIDISSESISRTLVSFLFSGCNFTVFVTLLPWSFVGYSVGQAMNTNFYSSDGKRLKTGDEEFGMDYTAY